MDKLIRLSIILLIFCTITISGVYGQNNRVSFADYFEEIGPLENFSKISNVLIKQELVKRGLANKSLSEFSDEELDPIEETAYKTFVREMNYYKDTDGKGGVVITFSDESIVIFYLKKSDSEPREEFLENYLGSGAPWRDNLEKKADYWIRIINGSLGKLPIDEIVIEYDPEITHQINEVTFEIEWEGYQRGIVSKILPDSLGMQQVTFRFEIRPDGSVGRIIPLVKTSPQEERILLNNLRKWKFGKLANGIPQQPQWEVIVFSNSSN